MPAATNKAELLAACDSQFTRLTKVFDSVDADQATAEDGDGVSPRNIVAHRAHWIGLWLGWEDAGRLGHPVHMPEKGYKWSELKPYNAMLRDRYAAMSWDEARRFLAERHGTLMKRLSGMSDEDLYGHPMAGGNGAWTAGRYAESAGSSHYRSASRVIRGWLRDWCTG